MDPATGAMASLLPKLVELLDEKHRLQASIREDVRYLYRELQRMQTILTILLVSQPWHPYQGARKLWADDARKLSYDMDVVLDKLLVLAPDSQGFKGLMEKMSSLLNKGKTSHQIMTSAIRTSKARVRMMADRCQRYGIYAAVDYSLAAMTSVDPRLMALYARVPDLVGIEGEKDEELIKLLSHGDNVSIRNLKIVSIVGFGGSGKTTLVKTVYDKIQKSFDRKAFVPAGQNADVKKVLAGIIVDLTRNYPNKLNQKQLIEKLQEILENKRYLIVIDDIWNENLWEDIKYAFSNKNVLGSRIITTTRIASVSKACCLSSNDSIYQMEPLSDDDSKKLLYGRILGSVNSSHEIKQLYSDILKKCGGVPSAIIAMASVLGGGPWIDPKVEWQALLKPNGRGLEKDMRWKNMQMILSFSYYDLPPHLKTCLLYFSTFPVTHPIEKDRLVKKLIAEGIVTQETKLIGSSNRKEAKLSQELSLEEAASQYLDELINRNVIQPLECNNNGEIISYHIHPMMHDVLKAIAVGERFAASLDGKDISRAHRVSFRHLSIDCPDSENLIDLSSMAFVGVVHSLTVFGHANQFLLRHFEGIRVLDLEGCKSIERADLEYICSMVKLKWLCLAKTQITELPPQIGKLRNLKGLDVGGTQLTELPTQIGNLQYLERLDVRGTQITQLPPQIGELQHLKTLDARKSRVKELPDQVVWLTGLVHLLIGDNESNEGVKLPVGIGKMTSLQQLCTIDLRKCSSSTLKELVELPCLKEIAVVLSDEPEDTRMNDALLSSLDKSTELRSLMVCSDFRLNTLQSSSTYKYLICRKKLTVVRRSLKVPIVIAGHQFIGMLDIRVCKLEEDDLKILRELPRLQSLIVRLEVLPTKMICISCEGFAKLESFYVDCRMPRVIFEEGAMPKLEHLELKLYAGSASEDHMGIKHLLNLQKVTLRYSKWHATNEGVKKKNDAMKTEAKEHQNKLILCTVEENKDGTCTMETEIFQENKDASCSKMIEIEEEDGLADGNGYFPNSNDTQEIDLHQSSRAIACSSGTREIEEVVE
ncbi:hypothetical protein CFC21_033377 [Triticum aestivum]|uniref:NB-ARC domain-containing protein n=2 Tax=Triticum aestivum TaxID=4565 RepID=A0A9R1JKD1_WHEAT|nr:disease resistance protein Pik-1-like [Triticum aestivum]XP_044338237.1 disease resistance protein Pik-1-like [Triticum aestivum]KAF7020259.1 hypothetical protein CFC21_033377 [Triticum aestivum]